MLLHLSLDGVLFVELNGRKRMNNHQKAIDIIAYEHNWHQLCVSIAKNNPKALVDALDDTLGIDSVKRFVMNGEKVNAIKLYRDIKQCSIKEAKEYVDGIAPEDK